MYNVLRRIKQERNTRDEVSHSLGHVHRRLEHHLVPVDCIRLDNSLMSKIRNFVHRRSVHRMTMIFFVYSVVEEVIRMRLRR